MAAIIRKRKIIKIHLAKVFFIKISIMNIYKMNIVTFVYAFILFFVLTPGILLSLPPKGSKIVVALTHAFVFALVWSFTFKIVKRSLKGLFEGMAPGDNMESTSTVPRLRPKNTTSSE